MFDYYERKHTWTYEVAQDWIRLSRVKAMEVDELPTETYTDIGRLEKQIEELVEAIILPMEQADKFKTLGI
ncbi:hypothetical protein DFH07DRAFT_752159 [Mycena maculata]|uniref:Uncharacterized protein n=1 Tax=Mycena maculata TaxID=230809 RepID=A0AAD7ID70_9AGAR|nr:hypothetical protein DFH07DRAFT_752159 [Mycena maculata]